MPWCPASESLSRFPKVCLPPGHQTGPIYQISKFEAKPRISSTPVCLPKIPLNQQYTFFIALTSAVMIDE